MSANEISFLFTLTGIIGLLSQVFLVQRISKKFGIKTTFSRALIVLSISFFIMFIFQSLPLFIMALIILSLSNSLVQPLTNTIISLETDPKSQDSILGISASYMSIGQILGPIVGGLLTTISITMPFLFSGILIVICVLISMRAINLAKKESSF